MKVFLVLLGSTLWLLLLSACAGRSHLGTPDLLRVVPSLNVDHQLYLAQPFREGPPRQYSVQLVTFFSNPSDETILLLRCNPRAEHPTYGLIQPDGEGAADSAFNPVWVCAHHDQPLILEVRPGEIRIDTLILRGPTEWDSQSGELSGALEGKYRLQYSYTCQSQSGGSCQLRDTVALSPVFEIRLAS